jgi:hypothetical protein
LEEFNGKLYAGLTNWTDGSSVWRSDDGRHWTQTSDFGFDGVQTGVNAAIGDLQVFNSQLYAGTRWGSDNGQIWRSADGEAWTQVSDPDFAGIGSFVVYNNVLYAGTWARDLLKGAEIWRSATGASGDWDLLATSDLTNNPHNSAVTAMSVFGTNLYAGIQNTDSGSQIWVTSNGTTWSPVNQDGFGEGVSNGGVDSLTVFQNQLFAGTSNCDAGGQVWRSDNGTAWTKVVDGGFGDINNCVVANLIVHGKHLYSVTNNHPWNGDYTGVEVWRTQDGVNWTQVNPDGFGDGNNQAGAYNNATVAVFHNSLFVGVHNWASGTEVWQMLEQVFIPLVRR